MSRRQSAESIEFDQRIARMYTEEDLTMREIADRLGLSFQRIQQRLKRTGTPTHPHGLRDPKILKMIDDMTIAGASLNAIAKVLRSTCDLSLATAAKYSRQRRDELRQKKLDRAVELYAIHHSSYVVAEIMGVSDMTVLNWLRKRGVDTSDKRPFDERTKQRALRLLKKKGQTLESVAAAIGCCEGTVFNWRREERGLSRTRKRSENEVQWHLRRRRRAMAKARRAAKERDRKAIAAAKGSIS